MVIHYFFPFLLPKKSWNPLVFDSNHGNNQRQNFWVTHLHKIRQQMGESHGQNNWIKSHFFTSCSKPELTSTKYHCNLTSSPIVTSWWCATASLHDWKKRNGEKINEIKFSSRLSKCLSVQLVTEVSCIFTTGKASMSCPKSHYSSDHDHKLLGLSSQQTSSKKVFL